MLAELLLFICMLRYVCFSGSYGPSIAACDFDENSASYCNLRHRGWRREKERGHVDRAPPSDHTTGHEGFGKIIGSLQK